MDVALQRRALKITGEALGRPASKRGAWVERACAGEPELMSAVARLLRSDEVGAGLLPTEPPEPLPLPDRPPPERIGPYRLTELLGEGGMSKVYLAERDDGLFDHAVAVKLMRPRAFGQVSRDLFDEERRILARLKHPNIAQLYDGGVDPDGAPYLVMERLTGEAIDDHVLDKGLDVSAIVHLVLQVCDAVGHAHRNLVVHADIKPSNVLIDHNGVAKLLDFGVAQTLGKPDQDLGGAFPVTAAYASPQRLEGERPSPADDVFSLGALLHDLLAGAISVDGRRGAPSDSGRRATGRPIDADLDAVTLQALAPRAEDRYASVDALADDLRRWLERRPVRARDPDWRMEAGGFVRRHPLAVGASLIALVGLIVSLVITTNLYVEARAARLDAERRFSEVRGMARYLMFDLYDRLDRTPQSLQLRRDLARQGQTYLARLTADGRAPVEVQVEAIEGLARLAAVQGQPGRSNLGEADAARANLARAARIAEDLTARYPERPDVWLATGLVQTARAQFSAHADNSTAEANRAMAAASAAIDKARSLGAPAGAVSDATVEWRLQQANLRNWQGRFAEGVIFARAALASIAATPGIDQRTRLREARAWDLVAEGTYYGGNEAGSEPAYRREVAVMEDVARLAPSDPVVLRALATARWALGTTLVTVGKFSQALPVLEAATADSERLVAFDTADQDARRTLRLMKFAKAQALAGLRRFDEAIALLSQQVAERLAIWRGAEERMEAARDYAVAVVALADVQAMAGRKADACVSYDRARSAFEAIRRKGRLTGLDQDHAIRLLDEHSSQVCGR